MTFGRKNSSVFIRTISVLLVSTFITSYVSAGEVLPTRSRDTLTASLVTDSNINPARSKPVQNDIAEKAEPGAIGNGAPLMELAQGKLPPRITLTDEEYQEIAQKLQKAIEVAIKLSVTNEKKVPLQHQARAKQALSNLITLQNNLSKDAYLYNADIRSSEDYLIGFNFQNYKGFIPELIQRLYLISPQRLAQYIYHECVPEKGLITERDDHRAVYNKIQSAIFGQDEVIALKNDLRKFINGAGTVENTTLSPHPEWVMGGNPQAIRAQEKEGQRELANSELLPVEGTSNEAEWAAIGVKLGKPKKGDPLFRHVILPSGWKIVPTDHDMWSKLVDDKGRVRAEIFYKAAFYDRRAFVTLTLVKSSEKAAARSPERIGEEEIGQYQNVREAWNKIVDLYEEGKIDHVVYVPRDIHDTRPIGQQYDLAPGDVIAERKANPIDHGGWTSIRVTKDRPHMTLMAAQGPVELFVDRYQDCLGVAKVVPVSASTPIKPSSQLEPIVVMVPDFDGKIGPRHVYTEDSLGALLHCDVDHWKTYDLDDRDWKNSSKITEIVDMVDKGEVRKALEKFETYHRLNYKEIGLFDIYSWIYIVRGLLKTEGADRAGAEMDKIWKCLGAPYSCDAGISLTLSYYHNKMGLPAATPNGRLMKEFLNRPVERFYKSTILNVLYAAIDKARLGDIDGAKKLFSFVGEKVLNASDREDWRFKPEDENLIKVNTLSFIAACQARLGDSKNSEETFAMAKSLIPKVNSYNQEEATKNIQRHRKVAEEVKAAPIPTPEPVKTSEEKPAVSAVLMTEIAEALPVRAKVFSANLRWILSEHPDQLFFMGIEDDMGEAQKAQLMPLYKALNEIREMKDANGKPLFPNLMVRRGNASELVKMAADLVKERKLNLNNAFIGARKFSVDNKLYDSIKGEGRAWIAAIDDSNMEDYLPIFEAITLNMMAYLNADLQAIKNFYDAISYKPINPTELQDMIRKRIIYILPRITKFNTKQLRQLYELAHQVYIAA